MILVCDRDMLPIVLFDILQGQHATPPPPPSYLRLQRAIMPPFAAPNATANNASIVAVNWGETASTATLPWGVAPLLDPLVLDVSLLLHPPLKQWLPLLVLEGLLTLLMGGGKQRATSTKEEEE